MSYDWHDQVSMERFSPAWFDAIDARFIQAARLFATNRQPFDRIIPFDRLAGQRVLEIGCGMGLHTELMIRAGAKLTSIDLSDMSVEATNRRLTVKGLSARVMQGDAEQLPFDDKSFDFVWSWGVIHHSSCTTRIVRQIGRVLTPEGSCRVMVYNRLATQVALRMLRYHFLTGRFLHRTLEETLYRTTDGFSARFYIPEHFEDLFRGFFADVSSEILGQDSDALPLPRLLRNVGLKICSDAWLKRQQARHGSFIFLRAARPF